MSHEDDGGFRKPWGRALNMAPAAEAIRGAASAASPKGPVPDQHGCGTTGSLKKMHMQNGDSNNSGVQCAPTARRNHTSHFICLRNPSSHLLLLAAPRPLCSPSLAPSPVHGPAALLPPACGVCSSCSSHQSSATPPHCRCWHPHPAPESPARLSCSVPRPWGQQQVQQ